MTRSILNTMLDQLFSPTLKNGDVTWHQVIPLPRDMYFKSTDNPWELFECDATSVELGSEEQGSTKACTDAYRNGVGGEKLCIAICGIILGSLHTRWKREVILSEAPKESSHQPGS